jgi:hypothetical protein
VVENWKGPKLRLGESLDFPHSIYRSQTTRMTFTEFAAENELTLVILAMLAMLAIAAADGSLWWLKISKHKSEHQLRLNRVANRLKAVFRL